jgi:hypothetical protein
MDIKTDNIKVIKEKPCYGFTVDYKKTGSISEKKVGDIPEENLRVVKPDYLIEGNIVKFEFHNHSVKTPYIVAHRKELEDRVTFFFNPVNKNAYCIKTVLDKGSHATSGYRPVYDMSYTWDGEVDEYIKEGDDALGTDSRGYNKIYIIPDDILSEIHNYGNAEVMSKMI